MARTGRAKKRAESPATAAPLIQPDEEILTTREAAALTKMSTSWYENARWRNEGPPFRRRGRAIRYVKSELLAWWIAKESGDSG